MPAAEIDRWAALYRTRPFGLRGRDLHTAAVMQTVRLAFGGSAPSLEELALTLNLDPDDRREFAERKAQHDREQTHRTIKFRAGVQAQLRAMAENDGD